MPHVDTSMIEWLTRVPRGREDWKIKYPGLLNLTVYCKPLESY